MQCRLRPLVFACLLAGNSFSAQAGWFGGVLDKLKEVVPAEIVGDKPTNQQVQAAPAQMQAIAVSARFRQIRSDAEARKIFESGRITGQQALTELRAMRMAMSAGDLDAAMQQLYGYAPDQAGQGNAVAGLLSLDRFNAKGLSDKLADQLIAGISLHALERFFTTLTDNPGFFAEEYVELPKNTERFTPAQRQRVLILATSLIAIKGSNKIVAASEKDYQRAREGYARLVEKREQSAALLATAIENWRMANAEQQELLARTELQGLNQEDLGFLAAFPKDMKLKDFVKDFAVQNIALDYMRKKGDDGFKDYQSAADEYVSTISAHLRKTVGLGSLLGFSSLFLKEGKKAFEREGALSIPVVLPFADQFLSELGTAAKDGLPSLFGGFKESLFGGDNEFRIEKQDGSVIRKKADAGDVVRQIERDEALHQQFVGNLYRPDGNGYLYRVNQCANAAGEMLDKAIPDETKTEFVKGFYRLDETRGFKFQDAFEGAFQPRRRDEVVSSLLATDYRASSRNETEAAIGLVQKSTEAGMSKWSSRDLAQIVFASNTERPHTHARLDIGDTVIRILPSQWMLYEYENYQQNCLKEVSARLHKDLAASEAPATKSRRKKK